MISFNPNACIECLACMTIDECTVLIDMIRHGGPRFGEEKCGDCSKCVDICGRALSKE